jgi:hypothetical protein
MNDSREVWRKFAEMIRFDRHFRLKRSQPIDRLAGNSSSLNLIELSVHPLTDLGAQVMIHLGNLMGANVALDGMGQVPHQGFGHGVDVIAVT